MVMLDQQQLEQRRDALLRANRVRSERAEIKRRLAAGEVTLTELLDDPPPAIATATIGSVLEWVPGIGHWRAGRILAAGPGSPGVTRGVPVCKLSDTSRVRIRTRYEQWVPFRYAPTA